MGEVAQRLFWFLVVACAVAYTTSAIAGSFVTAHAAESGPVMIRDELEPGIHHLSGMVMVPTPCDELSLHTEKISQETFELRFTTWHEPSVECKDDATPRPFREVFFAPAAGIQFIATLNGTDLPVVVLPEIPTR
jgi:hypothetical protein